MNFREYLDETNLTRLLYKPDYSIPTIVGGSKLVNWFEDIILNRRNVFVYGDYDVDGLMSLCIWKETLKDFNVPFKCFNYKSRTHNIDFNAVHECVAGNYDYMIIADTGSSEEDYKSINIIRSSGVKVLVVDHHQTKYNYDDFDDGILFINSTLDLNANLNVSGGALSYVCVSIIYNFLRKRVPVALSVYALTSLYADCVDMSGDVNRYIYYKATEASYYELPATIKHFMSDYDTLNKRYITFNYSPRINALFRAELFDVLNKYLIEPDEKTLMPVLISHIESIYTSSRDMVNTMTDIIVREELDNIIIANLSSVRSYIKQVDNLQNYTGLVANHLSSLYQKPCVVYYGMPDGSIKGSFRDTLNRPMLDIFNTFCDAAGHKAAFGIKLGYKDFNGFYENLKKLDKLLSPNQNNLFAGNQGMISILNNDINPDIDMLNDMAHYNEFAGGIAPLATIQRVYLGSQYKRTSYYHMYKWGQMWFKSSSPLVQGTITRLLPVKRRNLELRVVEYSSHF